MLKTILSQLANGFLVRRLRLSKSENQDEYLIPEVASTFGYVGLLALVHDIPKDVGILDVGGRKVIGKRIGICRGCFKRSECMMTRSYSSDLSVHYPIQRERRRSWPMAMIAFNLGNRSDQIVSRFEQLSVGYFLHSEQLGCNGRKKIRVSRYY